MKRSVRTVLLKIALFALIFGMPTVSSAQAADLWPLYENGKDSATVMYPFYVREGKFLMVFPFYYQTNQGRDKHFLWPIVKMSDGQPKRIVPFWFSNQDSFTLFPIIHQNQEAVTWFVPPVYVKKDRSFSTVFPFYAKGKNTLFIFPSYYHSKNDYSETLNLFPFYSSTAASAFKEKNAFLLFNKRETSNMTSTAVIPLYKKDKSKDGGYEGFWSLIYERVRSKDQVKTSFFPFFSTEWAISKVKDEKQKTTRTEILGPLYSNKAVRNELGAILERERNFLIFSDVLNGRGERSLKILGTVIAERIQ